MLDALIDSGRSFKPGIGKSHWYTAKVFNKGKNESQRQEQIKDILLYKCIPCFLLFDRHGICIICFMLVAMTAPQSVPVELIALICVSMRKDWIRHYANEKVFKEKTMPDLNLLIGLVLNDWDSDQARVDQWLKDLNKLHHDLSVILITFLHLIFTDEPKESGNFFAKLWVWFKDNRNEGIPVMVSDPNWVMFSSMNELCVAGTMKHSYKNHLIYSEFMKYNIELIPNNLTLKLMLMAMNNLFGLMFIKYYKRLNTQNKISKGGKFYDFPDFFDVPVITHDDEKLPPDPMLKNERIAWDFYEKEVARMNIVGKEGKTDRNPDL